MQNTLSDGGVVERDFESIRTDGGYTRFLTMMGPDGQTRNRTTTFAQTETGYTRIQTVAPAEGLGKAACRGDSKSPGAEGTGLQ